MASNGDYRGWDDDTAQRAAIIKCAPSNHEKTHITKHDLYQCCTSIKCMIIYGGYRGWDDDPAQRAVITECPISNCLKAVVKHDLYQ
jgi:hypothetical protein